MTMRYFKFFSFVLVMNIQLIIVIVLFLGAVFYMGRLVYQSLTSKKGCASGCGKCGADFSKIEPEKN